MKIQLSPLAEKMLTALTQLTKTHVPHDCGGFTTDDIQWRIGTAFTPEKELHEAIDELSKGGFIRYAGYDDEDAIGHCYEIKEAA